MKLWAWEDLENYQDQCEDSERQKCKNCVDYDHNTPKITITMVISSAGTIIQSTMHIQLCNSGKLNGIYKTFFLRPVKLRSSEGQTL